MPAAEVMPDSPLDWDRCKQILNGQGDVVIPQGAASCRSHARSGSARSERRSLPSVVQTGSPDCRGPLS